MYDYLLASTFRDSNRFADAYMQPEQHTLDQFDSTLPPTAHVGDSVAEILAAVGSARGTSVAGYETSVFWVVYSSTGFEYDLVEDNDALGEDATEGVSLSDLSLESIRDVIATETPPTVATDEEERARTTTHEIAHQFFDGELPDPGDHRNDAHNIMDSDGSNTADDDFYFDPREVRTLRARYMSPGQ